MVAFSPDEKWVLSGGGREACNDRSPNDTSVRLWDCATGKEIRRFVGHESAVLAIRLSPDCKSILTAGDDSTARLWDIESGKLLHVFSPVSPGGARDASFSSDGRYVLGINGQSATVWEVESGQVRLTIRVEDERPLHIQVGVFSPDGRFIVTASPEKKVRVWDAVNGKQVRVLVGHTESVQHVAFSANGSRIITASFDSTVRMWDVNTGVEIKRFMNPGSPWHAQMSPDGRRILVKWFFTGDGTAYYGVSLWDSESGKEISRIDGCKHAVLSPDGKKYIGAMPGLYAQLWDTESGRMLHQYK